MAFRRVLVGLDGSALADTLLPRLRPLLALPGAEALLVRVADPAHRPEAQAHLERARAWCLEAGITPRALLVAGDVGTRLAQVAEAQACDCIALAAHARTGPSRWILGSVAAQVIRTATVPVLVATAEALLARPEREAPFAFGRICVPLDGTAASARVLEPVERLARAFGAEVTLFHSTGDVLVVDTAAPGRNGPFTDGDALLAPHRTALVQHGIRVRTDVGGGRPAAAIAEAAARADLVAMTTRDRHPLARALEGSCAETVLRTARVPVLLLRVGAGKAAPAAPTPAPATAEATPPAASRR